MSSLEDSVGLRIPVNDGNGKLNLEIRTVMFREAGFRSEGYRQDDVRTVTEIQGQRLSCAVTNSNMNKKVRSPAMEFVTSPLHSLHRYAPRSLNNNIYQNPMLSCSPDFTQFNLDKSGCPIFSEHL